ncbi:MAG: divalent-cation tolerance protein CutA [Acidiferrobacteraceae bacterium]
MSLPAACLVLTTCPDRESADTIARTLITERVATCVNIVPGIASCYRWRGEVQSSTELLLLIKAPSAHYDQIEQRLQTLHPYELPEIIAVPIANGLPAYLSWLSHPE